ncbi:MAG TPA: hypothetical protein VHL80_14625 [Polyangia bacterium]|nr:hypothetical protein [Polyangia bacterium]
MIRALVRKELRQLLPAIVALGALTAWSFFESFVLKAPDTQTWHRGSWLLEPEGQWTAIAELTIGFILAYSVMPNEHALGTIDFLYSLPLRRRTVFLVKYLVAVGVHIAADVAGSVLHLLQHLLTPDSLGRATFRPWMAAVQLGADVFLPFVCVAYGLLVAYFRRLGWLLAVVIWIGLEVAERVDPRLRILNIKSLMLVEHDGTTPLVRWRAWALHAGMAAACLVAAERLWLGRQERFTAFYERLAGSAVLRRLAGVTAVSLVVLALVGAMLGAGRDKPATGPGRAGEPGEGRILSFDTAHFHFTYREPQAERALVIVRAADGAYDEIKRWLGAPDVDTIVADMTEQSDEHLGIAGWTKMRLDLARAEEPAPLLRHVLYHETTHVFEAAIGEGMSAARANESRFFAEGLAEYVAYELSPELPDEREGARRAAALAHRRYRLRFQDLLEPTKFIERYDELLLYPLGELFAAALVETCGRDAPREVLRAFASADTPQSLAGFDLWRYALQAQRCDVDRVLGRYEAALRGLETAAARTVPVATGRLGRRDGDALVFEVTLGEEPAGTWPVSVRVRTDATAPVDAVAVGQARVAAGRSAEIRVPLPAGAQEHVEFQVGARFGVRGALFSRWQSTALP